MGRTLGKDIWQLTSPNLAIVPGFEMDGDVEMRVCAQFDATLC